MSINSTANLAGQIMAYYSTPSDTSTVFLKFVATRCAAPFVPWLMRV